MSVKYDIGYALCHTWGIAPTRIDELLDQLHNGEDERRIGIAIEWYMRILNGVDPLISSINFTAARKELTLRCRNGLTILAVAEATGYEKNNMQRRLQTYMQAVSDSASDDLIRLIQWRIDLREMWPKEAVMRRVRGFDTEGFQDISRHCNNSGHRWLEINPEEVGHLMHEPGYVIDIRKMAEGPHYVNNLRVWE